MTADTMIRQEERYLAFRDTLKMMREMDRERQPVSKPLAKHQKNERRDHHER